MVSKKKAFLSILGNTSDMKKTGLAGARLIAGRIIQANGWVDN